MTALETLRLEKNLIEVFISSPFFARDAMLGKNLIEAQSVLGLGI